MNSPKRTQAWSAIKRLGEVSHEHFQSAKADYDEVKQSKHEALKALDEKAEDQRVVLDETLVILGDLAALWTSLDEDGKQAWVQVLFRSLGSTTAEKWSIAFLTTPSTRSSNSRRGVRIAFS